LNYKDQIEQANSKVMDVFLNGQPTWVDVQPAKKVITGMTDNLILVAGPPIDPENMVPPVRTSVCGAAVHEGLAKTIEEAWGMVGSKEIVIAPAQDYGCACGAAMATSASMPVIVTKDLKFGKFGFCVPHPGMGAKVLRWGFYDSDVEKDMVWYRDVFTPALGEVLRKLGGISLRTILTKTAGMGDENHNRQYAATMALELELIPALLDTSVVQKERVIKALAANERFFLHVMMAGALSVIQSAKNVPMSTIMVGMGGNGVEFGLQFSGTGSEWFCTKAPKILGIFLNPSWTEDDLCGYLGDSCVTEVYGLGGLSAIAGPSYVRLTGATFEEAKRRTENARAVCLGEHKYALVPWDDFRGSPVGVDMRKVVALNVVPTSHGGSTLLAGGQGGAGYCDFPIEPFKQGLLKFSKIVQGS
jgi:hypothetical protein